MTSAVAILRSGDLTPARVRAGLLRRGRKVLRKAGRIRKRPTKIVSRLRRRAERNRDFVRQVAGRPRPPAYWRSFSDRLSEAWYDGGRQALPVRMGVRSWRSLPGISSADAIEVGYQALQEGSLEWAEVIADAFIRIQRSHRQGNKLKALVHAERQEWRPAQDRWRTALGGDRHRAAARRWVINEQGRATARRLIAMMPDAETITAADGTSLTDLLTIRVDHAGEFDDRLGALLVQQITQGDTARLRPLLDAWSTGHQRERIVLAPAEVARSVRSMNLEQFRSYVAGRSIALVANSPSLLGSGLGPVIDGYDLVLRFNSFALAPADTGARTDIHVAFHKYDFNLDVPVDVRILLSAREELWRESLKLRIRPGAQRWLGDATLRWPAVSLGLVGPEDPYKLPTAGFNMTRLLLHLNVSSAVDLIGFDFYETGMHRLEGAAAIPHSDGHNSIAEKQWVIDHAAAVEGKIISMLPSTGAGARTMISQHAQGAPA